MTASLVSTGAPIAPTVYFPIYRRYKATRQQANNAMLSLLAGSALASHTLQLTEGSSRLLPEIFPAVPHIARFNLRPDAAAAVLRSAGPHLATVTVPYALAIHEDYVTQCIAWVRDQFNFRLPTAVSSDRTWGDIGASNMHEALESMLGQEYLPNSSVDLELFHLYRLMRNCHIHDGGSASPALRNHVEELGTDAQTRFREITKRDVSTLLQGAQVEYSLLDVFSIFAVTKELGHGVNALLLAGLNREQWADTCVNDFHEQTTRYRNSDSWGRGLIGHAHDRYQAVGMSRRHIFESAFNKGLWPGPTRIPATSTRTRSPQ